MLQKTSSGMRALLLGALVFASAAPLDAQVNSGLDPEPVEMKRPRGFRLFGLSDFAITSMRGAGNTSWHTTNAGVGNTFGFYSSLGLGRTRGTRASPTGYVGGFFEVQHWMLASRSDWSRARDDIPSLEKVLGGGFNSRTNLQRTAPDIMQSFQARDGSVGVFHSGVTTEDGTGTCRDMSSNQNGDIDAGVPILAISDCPPTWPNGVFNPERPVPDTVYLRRFRANQSEFTFADWKIPASERAQDKLYGSVQTYGATNDFGREARQRLGEVIPGQSGPPIIQGYPLGIEWVFNTFTYSVPTVADAMFYKVTLVNKSAEVYGGIGIRYDSLYLGLMARPIFDPQNPQIHDVPSRGSVVSTNSNVNGTSCYGNKTQGLDIRACTTNGTGGRGFNRGAVALVVLNSPIGDLRNKKFTDPTSPFFSPGHPDADDTLTYNVNTGCGVTCYATQIVPGNVRATWGALAAIEADALGGRGQAAGDLSQRQYFDLFHNEDFPARWTPSNPAVGGFNKYVPGNWDWNDDGQQDTLKLISCGKFGCTRAFSDTLPGGFPNALHNAFHAGVGPIKMNPGDTSSFTIALISSPDSVSFESTWKNVIDLYQSFWLSPEPPCMTRITSAVPTGGNRQFDTNIRLNFDQSVNDCQDKFLIEQAKILRGSAIASDVRLRVLNPTIVNDIRARALPAGTRLVDTVPLTTTANAFCGNGLNVAGQCRIVTTTALGVVDSLFIFKSCDAGISFTNSGGQACIPAPARDVAGASNDFPWQAYARLGRDAAGRFPAFYNDGNVTAGLTYTYVVSGASYPASFAIVDSVGGQLISSRYTVRPRVVNAISTNTSNSNVANVYVPASAQGGGTPTRTILTSFESDTSAQFSVGARLLRPYKGTTPLIGRLIFADSAEVQLFDADITQPGITSTTLRLYATLDTGGTTGSAPCNADAVRGCRGTTELAVFTVNESVSTLVVHGDSVVRKDSTVGNTRFSFTRYNSRGLKGAVIADGRPIFVTDSLTTTDITPAAASSRNDFNVPLFSFNQTLGGTFRGIRWVVPGIGVVSAEAYPNLTWVTDTSARVRDERAYSHYQITFQDKEFGPQGQFVIDRANPGALQGQVTASIAARKEAGRTVADAAAAAAINRALGITTLTADSLAVLKLPFTVRNATTASAVTIAVLKREHPQFGVFGTNVDTVRIDFPADAWVPGDRLYFIETFETDSTVAVGTRRIVRKQTILVETNAGLVDTIIVPLKTTTTRVTWGPAVLACAAPRTCNPIQGIGGTGYTSVTPNGLLDVVYYAPLRGLVNFDFRVDPEQTGTLVANQARDLNLVKVVPNPYVMFSQYEQTSGVKRLLFTHLPPTGTIRIYTASGQFVQQLTWTPSDLERNCQATTSTTTCESTGDLPWNMRTRENIDIGPGFYVFVVSTNGGGKNAQKLGKFVIIH